MSENGGTDNRDRHLTASTSSSPGRPSSRHGSAAAASLARLNSSSSLASSIASVEERLQSDMHGDRTAIAAAGTGAPYRGTTTSNTQTSHGSRASLEQRPQQYYASSATADTEERGELAINIRFGEEPDLSLYVARMDTVAEVKDKIKAARPNIMDKYLRLIHAGKVLVDDKTMIDSLPKSLFTHYEVPVESSARSRISTSLEAAVSHILTSHPHQHQQQQQHSTDPSHPSHGVGASFGAILPTHILRHESSGSDPHPNIPSNKGQPRDHVVINMPSEETASTLTTTTTATTNKTSIPLQTGPIYILCSLSDIPPRTMSSNKGKAVASYRSSPVGGSSGASALSRLGRTQRGGGGGLTGRGRIGEGSSSSYAQQGQLGQAGQADEEEEEEEEGSPTETNALLSPVVVVPPATAMGFDRLREAGFSEDEIRSIRREFHASRRAVDSSTSRVGENGIEIEQDEDAQARARQIEDEWIDQHGSETLPEGLEGSYGEMVWGLMLGFFMGLISLFWFKEATFTRRQQMGIVAGMTLNVVFGILRFL